VRRGRGHAGDRLPVIAAEVREAHPAAIKPGVQLADPRAGLGAHELAAGPLRAHEVRLGGGHARHAGRLEQEALGQRDVGPRMARADGAHVDAALAREAHDLLHLGDRTRLVDAQRIDALVAEVVAPGLAGPKLHRRSAHPNPQPGRGPVQVRLGVVEYAGNAMRLIRLSSLSDGMVLARDLRSGRPGETPLLRAGVRLSSSYIRRLHEISVHTVWIDDDLSRGIEPLPAMDPAERVAAEACVAKSFDRTAQTLASGGTAVPPQDLEELSATVARIAKSLADVPEASLALGDLASADAYTHRHSVQVALLGMLIARRHWHRDGWRDWMERPRSDGIEARLTKLGIGLILHDIGKLAVPLEIINKPGKLTDEEFAQIKLHPGAGVDLLRTADPSPLVMAAVRDHHERLDGTGYPAGRSGKAIHEFARICAVADVFDAITSERAYKHAAPPHVAVNAISEDVVRGALDPDIVAAFRRVCMPYPLGTDVVVDGKCLGVVSEIDANEPWMPTVRRMQGNEMEELTVDLRHLDAMPRAVDTPALQVA
jgi:HD-GYP domain-containing protein (c-di-GMP phosphodiesterase class II)